MDTKSIWLHNRDGMLTRFLLEALPADDLAAMEITDQVEVEEQTFGQPWQPCDSPRPDLLRLVYRMCHGRPGLLGRAAPSATVLRVGGA